MSLIPLGFWAASGGGGGGAAFDLLETQTLASSATSVTFSGLDTLAAGYKHLQIRAVMQSTDTRTSARDFMIRLNGDTGSNYAYHNLYGDGSSVTSQWASSQSAIFNREAYADSGNTNVYGGAVLDILDFSNTSKNTTTRVLLGVNAAGKTIISLGSGLWNNTNAVTSIELKPNIGSVNTGSRFSLIGVK